MVSAWKAMFCDLNVAGVQASVRFHSATFIRTTLINYCQMLFKIKYYSFSQALNFESLCMVSLKNFAFCLSYSALHSGSHTKSPSKLTRILQGFCIGSFLHFSFAQLMLSPVKCKNSATMAKPCKLELLLCVYDEPGSTWWHHSW